MSTTSCTFMWLNSCGNRPAALTDSAVLATAQIRCRTKWKKCLIRLHIPQKRAQRTCLSKVNTYSKIVFVLGSFWTNFCISSQQHYIMMPIHSSICICLSSGHTRFEETQRCPIHSFSSLSSFFSSQSGHLNWLHRRNFQGEKKRGRRRNRKGNKRRMLFEYWAETIFRRVKQFYFWMHWFKLHFSLSATLFLYFITTYVYRNARRKYCTSRSKMSTR